MLLSASTLMRLTVTLGVVRITTACNTNATVCSEMMSNALERPTAEEKCNGMHSYLECFQADIADCTDNSASDEYAQNMVKSYCSEAYICSDKLNTCYKDFIGQIDIIANSDADRKQEICGSLVPPIMACQEEVTSECKDQTGLLETVASHQASLDSVCSTSMPCLGKILQCQSSIIDMVPSSGDTGTQEDQGPPANCSTQTSIDYCGAYQQALSCMRANLTTCSDEFGVQSIIDSLENTTGTVCNPEVTCMQKLGSCLCYINSQNPSSIMISICSAYPPFVSCLDSLGPQCGEVATVQSQVSQLKANYQGFYNLFCTTEGGMCPPAIQCLADLTQPEDDADSSSGSPTAVLQMDKLCLVAGPVFKCLGSASKQCEEPSSTVTFTKIEDSYLSMCQEVAPHVQALSGCSSFSQCMMGFRLFNVGASAGNFSQADSIEVMRQLYVGLVKTDFWCSYLTHGYKCVADTALTCSLGQEFARSSAQHYTDIKAMCEGAPSPGGETDQSETSGDKNGNRGTGAPSSGGGKGGSGPSGDANTHHTSGRWTVVMAAVTCMLLVLDLQRQ